MSKFALLLSLVLLTVLIMDQPSFSHEGATGIVKERMDNMKAIGDQMKKLAGFFKGEIPYDVAGVEQAAAAISKRGGLHLLKTFPEGSLEKPTKARPEIWKNWQQFTTLAHQLEIFSQGLADAAGNPMSNGQGTTMPMGMGTPAPNNMMMGQGMMGQGQQQDMGPTADMLAVMPPDHVFARLAKTCNDCHTLFRLKEDK